MLAARDHDESPAAAWPSMPDDLDPQLLMAARRAVMTDLVRLLAKEPMPSAVLRRPSAVPRRPANVLGPRLFMAARRSDSERLRCLLRELEDEEEEGTAGNNAAEVVVPIMPVGGHADAAAPAASSSLGRLPGRPSPRATRCCTWLLSVATDGPARAQQEGRHTSASRRRCRERGDDRLPHHPRIPALWTSRYTTRQRGLC